MTTETKPQHRLTVKEILGDPEANSLRMKARSMPPSTQVLTPDQHSYIHLLDITTEILGEEIRQYKRGATLREKWATSEKEDKLRREMRRNLQPR